MSLYLTHLNKYTMSEQQVVFFMKKQQVVYLKKLKNEIRCFKNMRLKINITFQQKKK